MFNFFRRDNDHEDRRDNGTKQAHTEKQGRRRNRSFAKKSKNNYDQQTTRSFEGGSEELSPTLRSLTKRVFNPDHSIKRKSVKNSTSNRYPQNLELKTDDLLEEASGDDTLLKDDNISPSLHPFTRVTLSDEARSPTESDTCVEITLDFDAVNSLTSDTNENGNSDRVPFEPVMHMEDRLRKFRRIHRSQFSSSAYPAWQPPAKDEIQSQPSKQKHRVPLLNASFQSTKTSYQDMVLLLQMNHPKDETSAVKEELRSLNEELEALEKDRSELDKRYMSLPPSPKVSGIQGSTENLWDVDVLLSSDRHQFSPEKKAGLQKIRGVCLSVHLCNPRARESFLSKCGSKSGRLRGTKRGEATFVPLGPGNCRLGGAGERIRHIAIMKGTDAGASFIVFRDSGKNYSWGHLPPKLFIRMKREGMKYDTDLVYLSTGPRGCYYAEFQSGECWWGNAVHNDIDFNAILVQWDVYRVIFGPIVTHEHHGQQSTTNSWIILGRDGRAAWKNLPSRLHNLLSGRLADNAAPAEVALGSSDSYFIRFLDGTIDYCLPAQLADECERIEQNGGRVTDVMLHADVSHDYLIRHTELTQ